VDTNGRREHRSIPLLRFWTDVDNVCAYVGSDRHTAILENMDGVSGAGCDIVCVRDFAYEPLYLLTEALSVLGHGGSSAFTASPQEARIPGPLF
jgi:hypothetical protein